MSFIDFVDELVQEIHSPESPDPRGPREPVSQKLHEMKYRAKGEGFRDAMNRIASGLADNDSHFKDFREILLDMRFLPAGRIQSAIGSSRKVTAYNCFVSGTLQDNLVTGLENGSFFKEGGIMSRATEAAQTMRLGGGIGYDFSTLRPRGDRIKSMDTAASGPVSFMDIFDAICRTIASAGHRRGAQMATLRCDHPDIEEFIFSKQNSDRLNGFNISVGITDEFMEAVVSNKPFDLQWNGEVYKTIDASALWEQIMRSTWDYAEPGVLFLDTINRLNNLSYCETITTTNPCVPGDTPILTDKGYYPIETLVGKSINIWNGKTWSEVTPYPTGFNETVKVKLSDGTEFCCTPTHKFVLSNRGRKEAKNLKEGDKLAKFDMPVVEEGSWYEKDAYSQGFYAGDGFVGKDRSWVYEEKYCCIPRLVGNVGKAHDTRGFRQWYHGWMFNRDFVPIDARLDYCIDWLAGLMDSDGTAVNNPNSVSVQISSVNLEFLRNVRLMLTRLGVQGKISKGREESYRPMPDGKGGTKEYFCQTSYRLLINATDVMALTELGLITERLCLENNYPNRDARRFVQVVSVVEDEPCETFCFTESKNGTGTFGGIVTGQCAEQPLPSYGACLLGSFNLAAYISSEESYEDDEGFMVGYSFDWEQFIQDIPPVVRAMDNVIDCTIYPLKEQEIEAKNKRRMGLGVTGLANAGEAIGYPYGSKAFVEFEGKVLKALLEACYTSSALLAKEKGQFPWYDERYINGEFVKRLEPETLALMKKYGMRNSHLTSIAPTGTISLCADNISSGLEPVFAYKAERTVLDFEGASQLTVRDYGYHNFGIDGKLAEECTADDHLGVLIEAYKHVDSAVSKTCNVDPKMSWGDFKAVYTRAWENDCKGCTTFNIGGKRMGILKVKEEEPESEACSIDPETGRKTCE